AYYNVDNGTGKIRGVYLQGNQSVAPIFDAWMAPFKDAGMRTLTIANTGGTDHQSFDALGLPGFQFIQDEVEYTSRTHHSNMDLYARGGSGQRDHSSTTRGRGSTVMLKAFFGAKKEHDGEPPGAGGATAVAAEAPSTFAASRPTAPAQAAWVPPVAAVAEVPVP